MLSFEDLRADVESGAIDTVVVAFTDMQGRLMGKRVHGEFFVEETDAGHGVEGCNYLLALEMEMDPVPGYAIASWEQGYGDFDVRPDLATLRRIPWLEATALVLGDIQWHDGSPVQPSPRQVLRAQLERAAALGYVPMMGSELEFYLLRETYTEAHDQGYASLTPSVPYVLDYHILATTYDEPFLRAIRNGMHAAGMRVETSKGEAWPGQQEINFRFADALTMADNHTIYKNGAKEIAFQHGCSITFMAKPFQDWIGNSCHIHSSLWRDGNACFAEDEELFSAGSPGRSPASRSSRSSLRPRSTPTSASLRARGRRRRSRGGTTTGPAASASWPRGRAPGGDPDPGRRREPVPRVRGRDRSRAVRDRAAARAAAGARGKRLRVGRAAVPVHAPRGDRRARTGRDGARGLR